MANMVLLLNTMDGEMPRSTGEFSKFILFSAAYCPLKKSVSLNRPLFALGWNCQIMDPN